MGTPPHREKSNPINEMQFLQKVFLTFYAILAGGAGFLVS